MTLDVVDPEGNDDHEGKDLDSGNDHVAGRRDEIEAFTGRTLEHLTRVGYAVARKELRSLEGAADFLQEAFIRVLKAARDGRSRPDYPDAYFGRIVHNLIKDAWRANSTDMRGNGATPRPLDEKIQAEDPGPTPEKSALSSELRRLILGAIKTLSLEHQEILGLALDIDSGDFQRMSQAEIAEQLGITPARVKSRLHEAKKKLAICLRHWRKEN